MAKINGVVVGIVKSKPDDMGRIDVYFPWLSEENKSYPARVATMMAGPGRGSWFMPELEDEVLVAFEHGDVNHPYIVGFLWNGKDKPPQTDPRVRLLRTLNGHEIELYDPDEKEGDKGYIRIKDAHGNKIEMANARISITSVSVLEINATQVLINKRQVLPIPKPI